MQARMIPNAYNEKQPAPAVNNESQSWFDQPRNLV